MFRSIVRTDVANKTVASSYNQLSQTHSLPMVATRVRSKGREKCCPRRKTRKERTKNKLGNSQRNTIRRKEMRRKTEKIVIAYI